MAPGVCHLFTRSARRGDAILAHIAHAAHRCMMTIEMTPARYSRTAMILHWVIALAIAFQLALGWRFDSMAKGPGLFTAYQLHKSVGITILVLSLVRLGVRLLRPRPVAAEDAGWAQLLSKSVHAALYGVMVFAPLTGWIIVSTAKIKIPTLLFGVIPWPHLPVPASWLDPAEGLHALLGFVGAGLIALHVIGALRHQFVKGEPMLARMIPFAGRSAGLAAALALGSLFAAHAAGWQMPFGSAVMSVPVDTGDLTNAVEGPLNTTALPQAPLTNATVASNTTSAVVDPATTTPVTERETPKISPPVPASLPPTPLGDPVKSIPQPIADWTVAPGGRLGYVASWAGIPVNGRFNSWSAKIRFSPDVLDQSTISVSVALASSSTSDSQRDATISGPDFFNIAAHPDATYSATKFRALGGNRYEADGALSLHGVTRPVKLVFTLKIEGDTARVSGSTRLDRTNFGVGSGDYAATDQIGGNVAVTFNFIARR
jgi:cytochrome b561/polyisoprenoid-binding protein YceI